jgi:hypothetical protein
MNKQDFIYWLQGFFELSPDLETLSKEQVAIIRRHLNMVFEHDIDPALTPDPNKQERLNILHGGAKVKC